MGNCCPKPVVNAILSGGTTRSPSPVHGDDKKEINSKNKDGGGGESSEAVPAVPARGEIKSTPNLRMFTLAELTTATRNFRPDSMLGEGGFGRVFKGYIDPKTLAPSKAGVGIPVAVKKSNPDSEQGLREWQAEVIFLGKFTHPNLVKLLGYCWDERQFLLVYEYMQRGSLESHLFRKGGDTISWDTRIKIAIGAAEGLAFLHNTEKKVIYRDFKASNILLDGDFNAKLSDFGLAKWGPSDGNSHITTKPIGTYGYAAPEYMATGHLYVKSDVYGFGVVLLEIITGLRVLDFNRPSVQHNLINWALPSLQDKKKLKKLIDPRLMGQYPSRAAYAIAELILQCLDSDPKYRPSMDTVLERLICVKDNPKSAKDVRGKRMQDRRHRPQTQPRLHRTHGGGGGSGGADEESHRQHKKSKWPRSY